MSATEEGIRTGFGRNTNLTLEEDPESLLEVYKDTVEQNPESYSEFIQDVQSKSQGLTGLDNNCSIENDVYAQAFVKIARNYLDENMDVDTTYELKVDSIVDNILSNNNFDEEKAARVGFEIDRRYNMSGDVYSGEEEFIEKDDGALIIE